MYSLTPTGLLQCYKNIPTEGLGAIAQWVVEHHLPYFATSSWGEYQGHEINPTPKTQSFANSNKLEKLHVVIRRVGHQSDHHRAIHQMYHHVVVIDRARHIVTRSLPPPTREQSWCGEFGHHDLGRGITNWNQAHEHLEQRQLQVNLSNARFLQDVVFFFAKVSINLPEVSQAQWSLLYSTMKRGLKILKWLCNSKVATCCNDACLAATNFKWPRSRRLKIETMPGLRVKFCKKIAWTCYQHLPESVGDAMRYDGKTSSSNEGGGDCKSDENHLAVHHQCYWCHCWQLKHLIINQVHNETLKFNASHICQNSWGWQANNTESRYKVPTPNTSK